MAATRCPFELIHSFVDTSANRIIRLYDLTGIDMPSRTERHSVNFTLTVSIPVK